MALRHKSDYRVADLYRRDHLLGRSDSSEILQYLDIYKGPEVLRGCLRARIATKHCKIPTIVANMWVVSL